MLTILATQCGAIHHASPSDGADGLCDCVRKAVRPGDECRLHAGTYEVGPVRCELSGVHGTEADPITIASAGDGPVVIDGTVSIPGPWARRADGFYAAATGHDVLQLFVDSEMQVLARYPNARWSDKSVFYAVANWFRSTTPGVHDLATGEGLLRDQGACASAADCCARCSTHDLAASGINATGALAVLNLWSCDTGVQRVTRHDAATPSVLRYNASWVGLCDEYRGGDGRYFLEGLPAFLDGDEEWLFDRDTRSVLRTALPAATEEVRGRVADYALTLSNASFVVVANLSFHAATLSVAGDVGNVTLSSVDFNYSSVSRRALGDTAPPVTLALWRDDTLRPRVPAAFVLDDVAVRFSDGPALNLQGDGSGLHDSLFEWNDWTGVGGSWPLGVPPHGKAARATTLRTAGEALAFDRLSFRNNGAAQSFSAGGSGGRVASRVVLCAFESQLSLQDDGSFVEGGGVPATVFDRNWASSSGKAGLRWDGYYPDKADIGGMMLHNVVWNASAIMVKGDEHNVTGNTVFDGADIIPSHAARDRPRRQNHTSALDSLRVMSAQVRPARAEPATCRSRAPCLCSARGPTVGIWPLAALRWARASISTIRRPTPGRLSRATSSTPPASPACSAPRRRARCPARGATTSSASAWECQPRPSTSAPSFAIRTTATSARARTRWWHTSRPAPTPRSRRTTPPTGFPAAAGWRRRRARFRRAARSACIATRT